MGGNRKGKIRQYLNLFITMLLGGLWHGASLNFVFWGGLHGIALVIHKLWMSITKGCNWVNAKAWKVLMVIVTFHFVIFAWMLFRNADITWNGLFHNGDWGNIGIMLSQISHIFDNLRPEFIFKVILNYWHVFFLIMLGYVFHFIPDKLSQSCRSTFVKMPAYLYAVVLVILVVVIVQVKTSEVQPFIYFQF